MIEEKPHPNRLPLNERVAAVQSWAKANRYKDAHAMDVYIDWDAEDIREVVSICWTANGSIAEMKKVLKHYEVV